MDKGKENLDDMLQHQVTREELAAKGIEFADLGIKTELKNAKRLYFDKKGLAIQMEDGTYLNAEKMKQLVESGIRHVERECAYFMSVP